MDLAIMLEGQNGLTWPRWPKRFCRKERALKALRASCEGTTLPLILRIPL